MENCSLDLCLSPMTSSPQSCHQDSTVRNQPRAIRSMEVNAFYNGRLLEYDLVEIKVRATIEMASKEHDETTALELAPPMVLGSPLGSSVKRSVKKFLEMRKNKRSKSTCTPHSYTSTSSSASHN